MKITIENKIVTFLAIAPINKTSYDSYKGSLYEKSTNSFLNNYSYKKNKITILKTPISLPNNLFGDAFHLNSKGTIAFTNEIKSALYLK
jgi:hypothetical protein